MKKSFLVYMVIIGIYRMKDVEKLKIDSEFGAHTYSLNYARVQLFNKVFFICNLIVILLNIVNYSKGIGNKNPYSQLYIPAYFFYLVYFFIMSLITFYLKWQPADKIRWFHKVNVYLFAAMMLVWINVITFIDLRVNGGITVYALGLLGMASILFLNPIRAVIFYIISAIAFYTLLKTHNMPEDKIIADSVNGTIMIVVSFIISQIIFMEKKKQFIKDIQIQKQQSDLEKINSDLQSQNLKNETLQMIIKNYIPWTTWKKADLNSTLSLPKIPEEEIEITCLFLDIVNFTVFSEKNSPKVVIEKLNKVFRPIVATIYRNNGDIDKFIGDAVFAVFEDPKQALKSGFEIFHLLREADLESMDDIRIGIHTGRVIRGDVGGEFRRDNTLIGDTVNIASRLQTSCLPNELIISETSANLCQNQSVAK